MHTGGLSPFWAVWGLILWIVVLSLPILIYLAIAELQRARRRREDEPKFTLGEPLDEKLNRMRTRDRRKKRAG